jgi:hypothetical protein
MRLKFRGRFTSRYDPRWHTPDAKGFFYSEPLAYICLAVCCIAYPAGTAIIQMVNKATNPDGPRRTTVTPLNERGIHYSYTKNAPPKIEYTLIYSDGTSEVKYGPN